MKKITGLLAWDANLDGNKSYYNVPIGARVGDEVHGGHPVFGIHAQDEENVTIRTYGGFIDMHKSGWKLAEVKEA